MSLKQTDSDSGRIPPIDKNNFVGAIVFLIGLGTLVPWSFFNVADDFWMYKFRNASDPNGKILTPLQLTFRSYLSMAASVPLVLFLFINTAIAKRVAITPRIEWSLTGIIVIFVFASVGALIDTDQYQQEFLYITLASVVILNSLAGILQGGGSGAVAFLPERYMTLRAIGMGVAVSFASIVQVISLSFNWSPSYAALCYFSLGTALLICTLIGSWRLRNNKFYNFYVPSELEAKEDTAKSFTNAVPYMRIFLDGWPYYTAMFLALFVTLLCYPVLSGLIRPFGSSEMPRSFVPLACFMTFGVADCLGRLVAYYFPWSSTYRFGLLAMAAARVVFIPLLVWCNVAPNNRYLTSVLLPHEWQYITLMLVFGATQGYLIAVTMTYAPKSTSLQYQEVAGSMISLFDVIGILIGSMLSYLVLKLL